MNSGLAGGSAAWTPGGYIPVANRMSQLTLGVAVAQSETRSPPSAARSSPPSPSSQYIVYPTQ